MRNTKIVCTIGPATDREDVLSRMLQSGANVLRLNFSHGSHEEHGKRIALIQKLRDELGLPAPIMLDTKGPEIRLGEFAQGSVQLHEGQKYIITINDCLGDENKASISHKGIVRDVEAGSRILIADGLVELEVKKISEHDIECVVINGGEIGSKKGVNLPGRKVKLPAITNKDIEDIRFGVENGIEFIAASFVRKAEDVLDIRSLLAECGGCGVQIIAKIENREGLDNIDSIIEVADGIMVARGDLGVEIPTEEVPVAQKMIISKCIRAGKPVITATQMLDSMIRNPRPTRAEANDVANAIYDGTDAVMLSGETAIGKYPLEALLTMARIAEKADDSIEHEYYFQRFKGERSATTTNAISYAACSIAQGLRVKAILTATETGQSARMVSKHRPDPPILATTICRRTYRQLALVWGVIPAMVQAMDSTDKMFEQSVKVALEKGIVKQDDLVVITAGVPIGISGSTNLIKVHKI
jgi:pyruvate kinase